MPLAVMSNHYHFLIWMETRRSMAREELKNRAEQLYSNTLFGGWLQANWDRFEERIFDVSELMRRLQSSIDRWCNYTLGTWGRIERLVEASGCSRSRNIMETRK